MASLRPDRCPPAPGLDDAPRAARPAFRRLTPRARWNMLAGAVGLALVFVLGYLLEPDPRGHGTHVQMGLAPCTTRALFGLPCPFCGMTTSVSHLAHGDMAASIRTQPAGFVAGVGAALVGCLLVAGALIGRWPAVDPFRGLALRMLIALGVGGLLASWLYKMAQEGVF